MSFSISANGHASSGPTISTEVITSVGDSINGSIIATVPMCVSVRMKLVSVSVYECV